MYNTALNTNTRLPVEYLRKEIFESSQEKLLIKIYDFAIMQCKNGNMIKTNDAISVLISSLDFSKKETISISSQLLSLYQFAQEQMRKGEFEIVLKILYGLKESWKTVL